MKSLIKSALLVISGILLSLGLLYGYSVIFKNAAGNSSAEALRFVPIEPGDAVISHISGEIYIIREEKMITPRPGDAVREGDVIKVVDDSWCQIQVVGKATMRLRSNSLVRIQRLLSNNKDIDIKTELLTGSMIYKVDRLNATDNLEVVAQEKIFKVEGTEFFIEAFAGGGSRVAVREGRVAVLDGTEDVNPKLLSSVTPGKSLDLREWKGDEPIPEVQAISREQMTTIEREGPTELFRQSEKLVYLEVKSSPAGADLYINGRLAGKNTISGLYPGADVLKITARKRGYSDLRLEITPEELTDSTVIINLEPLGLDESLESEQSESWPVSIDDLKAEYEREKENILSGFKNKWEENQQKIEDLSRKSMNLESSIKSLKKTNSQLETELTRSQEEQQKLRELLLQIQELSSDQPDTTE